jgi:exonuclease SbcC
VDKENLEAEKSKIDTELATNNTRLEAYRQYLKSNLDLNIALLNKKDLIIKLDLLLEETKNQLSHVKSLHEEYEKLDKYCDNVWPFIQSEKAKEEIRKTKEELEFLTKNVEPILKKERSNTKKYLETRIKDFFHEDLINSLYRKIDPHPDFKTVEFLANFDADNPRLDVFVRNEKDENKLIPNLYFSTAQINILSLSIFLASALNSKDYQCIFIDDPIQSMDSINVLSTIDLIRSLVVNEGKQIILSTHDENFHKLLKKKMPPELFESKFLELESFGKVKKEISL